MKIRSAIRVQKRLRAGYRYRLTTAIRSAARVRVYWAARPPDEPPREWRRRPSKRDATVPM